MRWFILPLLGGCLLLAAACATPAQAVHPNVVIVANQDDATPVVLPTLPPQWTPTLTPPPSATQPTHTPSLTFTSTPSRTPSATPTITPSLTPTRRPRPKRTRQPITPVPPTITPTGTRLPSGVLNPLTGADMPDPPNLERRPLAIKIANFPRKIRPQMGLSLADNVWEHYAEGGVTRFTAIFLGNDASKVGNVRSARLLDIHLSEAYQAMLIASGSSKGTLDRIEQTEVYERLIAEATGFRDCPVICREADATESAHKLFTATSALWQLTAELGLNQRQTLEGFAFSSLPPPNGAPVTTLHIAFQAPNAVVEWRYDPTTQLYQRWIDTNEPDELTPHMDSLTGQMLTAATVVMVFASHTRTNIHEDDSGLHYSYDIAFIGSGSAKIFRNGQMYDATWERTATSLPIFKDPVGQIIPFMPGQIWFEVLTPESKLSAKDGLFTARMVVQ